jgi:hypothetical protein
MKLAVRIEVIALFLLASGFIISALIYGAEKSNFMTTGVGTAWSLIACKTAALAALATEAFALIVRRAAGMVLPCLILGLILAVQIFNQAFGDATITIFGTIGMLVAVGVMLFVCIQYKKEETYQALRSGG